MNNSDKRIYETAQRLLPGSLAGAMRRLSAGGPGLGQASAAAQQEAVNNAVDEAIILATVFERRFAQRDRLIDFDHDAATRPGQAAPASLVGLDS